MVKAGWIHLAITWGPPGDADDGVNDHPNDSNSNPDDGEDFSNKDYDLANGDNLSIGDVDLPTKMKGFHI